ncbi:sulfurtransferase TusA [Candidatus Hoaglandella endobia]|uniref:Sulfur carrier protein TusA n=1 Tax=Candidatus Hoaglandella endobia TaxID=1778263 RepID=A0A143WU03_9ENTR|nr:sulfurtransferase TusA [Candidatus Hoaglandella endobia]CUX97230.1 Sulfurtransferase TusA [Candidatus Hoaglandella endobia]
MSDIFTIADKILDVRGLQCPEPLMIVRKTIRDMNDGQKLVIITDDLATTRDIPSFCRYMEHALLAQSTEHFPYLYLLRKGLIIN